METFYSFFTENPAALTAVGSQYLWYALAAWAVILVRAIRRRFTRLEIAAFVVYTVLMAGQLFQLLADRPSLFARNETWGLPRYLGVFAPLLWLWTAKALADLWSLPRCRCVRYGVRILIVSAFAYIAVVDGFLQLRSYGESCEEAKVRFAKMAEAVSADYAGPARQERRGKKVLNEYYTTRRPVVFSDFAAVAWMTGGQSEGAEQGVKFCPYPVDYLCTRVQVRADEPVRSYGGIDSIDPKKYDYLTEVAVRDSDGSKTAAWRIFRRKGVLHKKPNKE